MEFDKTTAIEILNEYNSGGFEDHIELPDDEDELVKKATELYHEAQRAFESGMRDNAIQSMLWIGDSALAGQNPRFPETEEKERKDLPRRSSGGISEQDEREGEKFLPEPAKGYMMLEQREHLPAPEHIEGDPETMPRDLSNLSDKDVRRLSGIYNAYLARVTYLLGIESSDLANAEHLLEAARARTLRGLDLVDPNSDGKKQKLAKVIEAEIMADTEVVEYSAAVNRHTQMVIVLKSLREIYSGNVDRLSREWTMRQNEWEKSRK